MSSKKKKKAVAKKKKPLLEMLVRVSITFDVGVGWRGTKSRDFPGRHFTAEENIVLQDWSAKFRQGEPCVVPKKDLRTVTLPPGSSGARRRKPFIGATMVTRQGAYHWFRETQERLVDSEIKKNSTL